MAIARNRGDKVSLQPLEDRVIVERREADEKTAGGIVLPDSAKEKPQRGIVIAVGPGRLLKSGQRGKISISVGDEIIFSSYGGVEINVEGDKFTILRETEILASLPGDPMTTGPRPRPRPNQNPSTSRPDNGPTPPVVT